MTNEGHVCDNYARAVSELEAAQERIASLEAQLATAREGALREAIEVVERWTWGTVNEMDTGKKRTLGALEKLLTEKRTP